MRGTSYGWLVVLAVAMCLAPINEFIWGERVLRQFGAQSANFVLAGVLIFALSRRMPILIPRTVTLIVLPYIAVVALNCLVVFGTPWEGWAWRDPALSYLLQSSMILWELLAFGLWALLFRNMDFRGSGYAVFLKIVIGITAIHCFFVLSDLLQIVGIILVPKTVLLTVLQVDRFRPSGLLSEPSAFGDWVNCLWPLLVIVPKTARVDGWTKNIARLVMVLALILAFMSGSRSFIGGVLLQLGVMMIYSLLRPGGASLKLIFGGAVALIAVVGFSLASDRVGSAFTAQDDSAVLRYGKLLSVAKMAADYPLTGVGLGSYTTYEPYYLGTRALHTPEMLFYDELPPTRGQSTGNAFLKYSAEMGSIGGLCASLIFLFPLISCFVKRNRFDSDKLPFIVSYAGGLFAIIFNVDIFSYAPAAMVWGLLMAKGGGHNNLISLIQIFRDGMLRRLSVALGTLVCALVLGVGVGRIALAQTIPVYQTSRLLLAPREPDQTLASTLSTQGAPAFFNRLVSLLDEPDTIAAVRARVAGTIDDCAKILDRATCSGQPSLVAESLQRLHRLYRIQETYGPVAPAFRLVFKARTPEGAQRLADASIEVGQRKLAGEWLSSLRDVNAALKNAIPDQEIESVQKAIVQQTLMSQRDFIALLGEFPLASPVDSTDSERIWPIPKTFYLASMLMTVLLWGVSWAIIGMRSLWRTVGQYENNGVP